MKKSNLRILEYKTGLIHQFIIQERYLFLFWKELWFSHENSPSVKFNTLEKAKEFLEKLIIPIEVIIHNV